MIKTVIFDFDGTLCDSFGEMMESFNEVCLKYGSSPDEQSKDVMRSKGAKVFLATLKVDPEKYKDLMDDIRRSMAGKANRLRLFEGVELIKSIKEKGVEIGIISSSPKEHIVGILKSNNADFIDFVIFEDNVFGKDKTILDFMEQNRLEASEVAYVGDEIRDIEAANKAGVLSVAVTWGYNSKELLATSNPSKIVDSFEELASLFN